MEARYNVYFAGQLLEGQDPGSVRISLAKLFNADEATLEKLFSGNAQLIKRNCDKATALKYKQAMERAGAQALIKAVAEPAAQTQPKVQKTVSAAERIAALAAAPDAQSYSAKPAAPEAQNPVTAGDTVGLAPPGADVLRPEERPQPVVTEIDTSELAVDAPAQRLSQEAPPPPPPPDTSHLAMGEVGETIPHLPSDQTPLSPNTDDIGLSPAGTDFSDCAADDAVAPELDLSAIDLAPAGSAVLEEQYRKHEKAAAPDTDHISLEE